jgi:Fe-S cluster assembly protein SufD
MSVPATIAERKTQAAENFRAAGLPNRRLEDWKYTDLKAALGSVSLVDAGAAQWSFEALPDGVELFDLARSDAPEWVQRHLGVLAGEDAPGNASLAFASAGFALRVPKGASAGEARVRISGSGNLRALVMVEEGASLSFAEIHDRNATVRNVGLEILIYPDASLSHLRFTPRSGGVATESIKALLKENCRYAAHFADFGAKLSRADLYLKIAGEGAEVKLSGVSVLGGSDHADVTTHIEHAAGKAKSTQVFKYLAGGKSRAVYQGRITVDTGADGTDSRQLAKAILVGDRAEADLKPELLIFADDVQCAHGAAVGDLDTEALYYLRSRGVPEDEAREVLIRAFLGEAVDEIAVDAWHEMVWREVETALRQATEVLS